MWLKLGSCWGLNPPGNYPAWVELSPVRSWGFNGSMASIDNALRMLDDAITHSKRIEREAQAAGQADLHQKIRKLRRELDDLEYELRRVKQGS